MHDIHVVEMPLLIFQTNTIFEGKIEHISLSYNFSPFIPKKIPHHYQLDEIFRIRTGLQIRVRIGKLFSLFFIQTYVVDTQKNRLNETILLSTPNTCLKY